MAMSSPIGLPTRAIPPLLLRLATKSWAWLLLEPGPTPEQVTQLSGSSILQTRTSKGYGCCGSLFNLPENKRNSRFPRDAGCRGYLELPAVGGGMDHRGSRVKLLEPSTAGQVAGLKNPPSQTHQRGFLLKFDVR
ncbi:hypothetical protein E3N88_42259 [Mikania micrantha]|uniref:Uncharacterized protein n=1 Tax=Mikania micrantha TaxID=192012 RepID=A0A5N6LIB6_9ASTR|nr:hypothetical protein E3N88_42259 [Mikania micrantha]